MWVHVLVLSTTFPDFFILYKIYSLFISYIPADTVVKDFSFKINFCTSYRFENKLYEGKNK